MEEITKNNFIDLIKEKFPKFIPYWEENVNYWGLELASNDVIPFAYYALNEIKLENKEEIEKIFIIIESLMCVGDEYVKTVTATYFLEYLLSKDPDEIQFIKFPQYLGKETIAYCRAWDKFTGVMTKGLHDD